jgi:3-oxoacyl-[acyl-carrier protein] reductase
LLAINLLNAFLISMNKLLEGKTALITGASRGIGLAVVKLFRSHGANIFCCARTEDKLEELRKYSEDDTRIHTQKIDLKSRSEIDSFFTFIRENTNSLDIVINVAGVHIGSRIESIDEADYDSVMNVNLKAPLLICRSAIPLMENAGGGCIVNVSSLSGCFGLQKFESFGAYNISKYGLWGLTEILAIELKNKNIRVNQVSPSGVDTQMFYDAVPPGVKPSLSPEDVANTILYLASDSSTPLTGENIRLFG